MRHVSCFLAVTIVSGVLLGPAVAEENKSPAPLEIGTHRQLFIDDFVIDKMEAIRRNTHQAEKYPGNPVLTGEAPWEGPHGETGGFVLLFGSVERHPQSGKLRMWYMSAYEAKPPGPKHHIIQCIAESEDGVRWQRPVVGLVPFNGGSKENNIVFSTAIHSGYNECLTPIRDPNPKDPSKRYRSLFWASAGGFRGTYSASSPDGLSWTSGQKPVFTDTGDAGSIMYDTIKNRWIFLARPLDNQLSRAVSFSEDFQTWTPLKVIFQADKSKREDFYNMTGFCYQGIYLGLVVVMWEEPDRYALEPHLVMSRDGENWSWVGRQNAFIPHGPRGSFDEFNTQMGAGEPVRVDDKLHFYFSGRTYPHRPYYLRDKPELVPKKVLKSEMAIGLATLRVDGFASLEDHWGGGTVRTKPLIFKGSKLHLNAAFPHGELRVEVLDEAGEPIPGYSADQCQAVQGDAVDALVKWQQKESLQELAGRPVRLRFHLKRAKLYSFWVD